MALIGPNRDDWSELQCTCCSYVIGEWFGPPLPDLYCIECAEAKRQELAAQSIDELLSGVNQNDERA